MNGRIVVIRNKEVLNLYANIYTGNDLFVEVIIKYPQPPSTMINGVREFALN